MLEAITIATISAIGAYTGKEFDVSGGSDYLQKQALPKRELVASNRYGFFMGLRSSLYHITVDSDNPAFVQSHNKLASVLRSMSSLQTGWDGRGAAPINPLSIENVKAVAEHQWSWNFKLWQIAPGVNGDIFINYKGKNKLAGFVIGPTTFSYFIEGETLQGDSNVPFDGLRVSTLMNTIVNA